MYLGIATLSLMSLNLKSALPAYFNQYKLLEGQGRPERNGDLFEEVLAKEEEILSAFGLPVLILCLPEP